MDTWTKKQIKLIDKYINKLEKLYIKEYEQTLQEIIGELLTLYSKIIEEGEPLLSHLYQYKRYSTLIKNIQKKLTQLGVKQETIFMDEMTKFYKDNIEVLQDQFERPFDITDEHVKEVVKRDFLNNTLWSDSIWKDKALLLTKVKHQLILNLTADKTVDQMAESLQAETLTNNFYNAKRLVRTEVVNYYVKTTIEKYKEAGINKVQYHSNKDDRTCKECLGKDSVIYSINSKALPPTHPNCRCWITAVL